MGTEEELSFMTWNSHGLKSKTTEVETEINKCDIVFIQETHIGVNDNRVFEKFEKWKSFFTSYKPRSRGVAILIREGILTSKISKWKDNEGCFVVVKCTIKDQLYTLVSVYIPQGDSRPLEKLRERLENSAEGILLIGGDFNIALNPYLDKSSVYVNAKHKKLKPFVEKLMTSFHLVDVWRRLNPSCRGYTFPGHFSKSRLDCLFVPEESMQYVKSCVISEEPCRSDHQPVLFKIRCNTTNTSNDLDVIENTEQRNISEFVSDVSKQWLGCKQRFWGDDFNLTFSQDAFEKFQVKTIEKTIQYLAVNKNEVKRPDGVSLLFYKRYSCALSPYLCVLYHNLLEQSTNVLESFSNTDNIPGTLHYIFNVDYLILATIMARWLNEYLQFHSTHIPSIKKKVLFAFEEGSVEISWSFLEKFLRKEQERDLPLSPTFNIGVLEKLLKNSSCGTKKLLCWGCPLTPVLKRLCLTHVAEEFLKAVEQSNSVVYISRENVIVSVSGRVKDQLKNIQGDFPFVYCEFVNNLTRKQSEL